MSLSLTSIQSFLTFLWAIGGIVAGKDMFQQRQEADKAESRMKWTANDLLIQMDSQMDYWASCGLKNMFR